MRNRETGQQTQLPVQYQSHQGPQMSADLHTLDRVVIIESQRLITATHIVRAEEEEGAGLGE